MLTIVKKNDSYDAITYQLENEDNSTVDLTGASVNFVMGKKNKLITNAKATVTSATSGIVSYQLTPLDTLVSGTFLAEFVVTFANGTVKTYPSNGYITVDVEQNLDTSQANVVVDMIAEKQGDFTSKLNSILQQAGNINMSAMNEYSWTATEGQLIFIFPSSVNYTPSTKWFQVSVGNVPVDNTLVNRSYDNQFALNIDSSNIKAGMTVRAMWVEPITPVVPNSYKIIPQQDLPPVDAGEGDLWFDTSDNTYQGTVFNDLNTRVSNNETSLMDKAKKSDTSKEFNPIKGITLMIGDPGYVPTQATLDGSITNIKNTGFTDVFILVYYNQTDGNTGSTIVQSVTDTWITTQIQKCKDVGLNVKAIKFHLYGATSSTSLAPSNPTTWFTNYQNAVTHIAQLCQPYGIEYFVISNERTDMTQVASYVTNWQAIINAVKALGYKTMCNCTMFEAYQSAILSYVDAIGINMYPHMSNKGTNATLEECIQAWRHDLSGNECLAALEYIKTTYNKPTFVSEVGCPPYATSLSSPEIVTTGTPDYTNIQNKFYLATLYVLGTNPNVDGMFIWESVTSVWNPFNEPVNTTLKQFFGVVPS
jgi:hypothetical protein